MVGKFGLFATCCRFGADAIYLFGKEADRVLHGGLGYDRVRLIDAVKKGACAGRPWWWKKKVFCWWFREYFCIFAPRVVFPGRKLRSGGCRFRFSLFDYQ